MSGVSLTVELIGALIIGYVVGYFYSKSKFIQKYKSENKKLRDSLNEKEFELIELKKITRDEKKQISFLEDKLKIKDKTLQKYIKRFKNLKIAISAYKDRLKDKKQEIKELESLLLDIQNDYETLKEKLNLQEYQNKKLKEEFEQKIEELTQKANDLFMVKGTEELKNAKSIFDNLREKSLKKLKG